MRTKLQALALAFLLGAGLLAIPGFDATASANAGVPSGLASGETLAVGQSLWSPNGRNELSVLRDGNLVLRYHRPLKRNGKPATSVARKNALRNVRRCRAGVMCTIPAGNVRRLWSSNTSGHADAVLTMQADGNLVLSSGGAALWSSKTAGNPGAHLGVLDSGNVALQLADEQAQAAPSSLLWNLGTSAPVLLGQTLGTNQTLQPGQYIESPSGLYDLYMDPSGVAVLSTYPGSGNEACPMWSAPAGSLGTPDGFDPPPLSFNTTPGAHLTMQFDGNLVLYTPTSSVPWASYPPTVNPPAPYLAMQDDGNLVTYTAGGGSALWASGSNLNLGSGLCKGESLSYGQYLEDYTHALRVQLAYYGSDGSELDLVGNGTPTHIWRSKSAPPPSQVYLLMQDDGNLVIYPIGGGAALWASATENYPGAFALLQWNGAFSVYPLPGTSVDTWTTPGCGGVADSEPALWTSVSSQQCSHMHRYYTPG